jgi:hypothetical protein
MSQNLREETERRLRYQEEQLASCKTALAIIELLPQDIQNLCGNIATGWPGCDYHISFYQFDNKDIDLIRVLKMAGVQGLTIKMTTDTSPNYWESKGEFMVGDKNVGVHVFHLPKPQTCHIEEIEETVVVKKYKAICNESGEEVGV